MSARKSQKPFWGKPKRIRPAKHYEYEELGGTIVAIVKCLVVLFLFALLYSMVVWFPLTALTLIL